MRYIAVVDEGKHSRLYTRYADKPDIKADEVLIRASAAGVNHADLLQRRGLYPPPPGASAVLGLEVAGLVEQVGKKVNTWSVGDRVCALLAGGGYAEYVAVKASHCLPVPDSLSDVEAAALPEAVASCWSNLHQRAHLSRGESLLMHGGSSGIGSIAIQMAKLMGATVITTVGDTQKQRFCEGLGADLAINYKTQDYVAESQAFLGRGVDVIVDIVGGEYVARNIALAAPEGRIVNIAHLQGAEVTVNLATIMLKRLTLTGSTLRARSDDYKAALIEEIQQRVWPWLEKGALEPVVEATYDLDAAEQAHMLMHSSRHKGKIVLTF